MTQFTADVLRAIDAAIESRENEIAEIFDAIADDTARAESERKARAALAREVRDNG